MYMKGFNMNLDLAGGHNIASVDLFFIIICYNIMCVCVHMCTCSVTRCHP